MKVILDLMGSDNGPEATVEGAIWAQKEYDIDLILVGQEKIIKEILTKHNAIDNPRLEVVNADDVIAMDEDINIAVRKKKQSSMFVALSLLAEGKGDAMVSAGSTGAFLTGATLMVKRIKGIRRAALAPVLPTLQNGAVLVDCGANAQCVPEYLVQFAYMGAAYAEKVMGINNPRVAIINNGAEETKGTDLYVETHQLLKEEKNQGKINFVGNAEGRDVSLGMCDVIVSDGFTGNVLLKTTEGVGLFFSAQLKEMFTRNIFTKIAALIMSKEIGAFKKKMDHTEVGGAPLLGISKPCIKAHGSSNAKSYKNAIGQAIKFAESGVIQKIEEKIAR